MFEIKARFAPGQKIRLNSLQVDGYVWQVMCMPGGLINYDCFWWFNGERRASVLVEQEISEA